MMTYTNFDSALFEIADKLIQTKGKSDEQKACQDIMVLDDLLYNGINSRFNMKSVDKR